MAIAVNEDWIAFSRQCRSSVPLVELDRSLTMWCTHPSGGHSCKLGLCPREINVDESKE